MFKRVQILMIVALVGSSFAALVSFESASAYSPANDPFHQTWARTDKPVADGAVNRTWMWGPSANTESVFEPYLQSPGGEREVQYYDKTRMEINNPNANPNELWYVTNGLLAMELITGQMQVGDAEFENRQPAQVQIAGDPHPNSPTYAMLNELLAEPPLQVGEPVTQRLHSDGTVDTSPDLALSGVTAAHYVELTDHTVASPFWEFMNSTGPVYENGQMYTDKLFENPFFATGLPITEAYWVVVPVGGAFQDVLAQCFERRCLTYTPNNPDGWQVEAANIGQHYYEWREQTSADHEEIIESVQTTYDARQGTTVRTDSGFEAEIQGADEDAEYELSITAIKPDNAGLSPQLRSDAIYSIELKGRSSNTKHPSVKLTFPLPQNADQHSIFVVRRGAQSWDIADGETIVSDSTISIQLNALSSYTAVAYEPPSGRPDLHLPFSCGQTAWAYTWRTADDHHDNYAPTLIHGRGAIDFNMRAPSDSDSSPENLGRGEPIIASADGVVSVARHDTNSGTWVEIDHGGGWQTRYLHLIEGSIPAGISNGNRVSQGDELGELGDTGAFVTPGSYHLHYEQRFEGQVQPVMFNGPDDNPEMIEYVYLPNKVRVVSHNCPGSIDDGAAEEPHSIQLEFPVPRSHQIGESMIIEVHVRDRDGNPVRNGTLIRLDIEGANGPLNLGATTTNGIAVFSYSGHNTGIDNLTAVWNDVRSPVESVSWTDPINPAPYSFAITAGSTSLDIGETYTIGVTVFDQHNERLQGAEVTGQITGANSGWMTPNPAVTDSDGNAYLTYQGSTAGNDTITVSVSGIGATRTATTTWVEGDGEFSCDDVDFSVSNPTIVCEVLVQLYDSTNGDNWDNNSGWFEGGNLLNWYGINWATGPGDAFIIHLNDNNLTGTIPAELGDLGDVGITSDIVIDLSHNQLTGEIPAELGEISTLGGLSLQHNNLSGTIPESIGNLNNLSSLRVGNNPLSGGLPSQLMNTSLTGIPDQWWIIGTFWFENTDLCEPADPQFQAWLDEVEDLQRTGVLCDEQSAPTSMEINIGVQYQHTATGRDGIDITANVYGESGQPLPGVTVEFVRFVGPQQGDFVSDSGEILGSYAQVTADSAGQATATYASDPATDDRPLNPHFEVYIDHLDTGVDGNLLQVIEILFE